MSNSNDLLVLGATGQAGKIAAKNLRSSGANFSVGTRRKANLETLADQFGASRYIDLDDPRTFDEALNNATGIFPVNGYTVDMLVQRKTLIDEASWNGFSHIVHPGAFTREHRHIRDGFCLASDGRSVSSRKRRCVDEFASQYVYAEFASGVAGASR